MEWVRGSELMLVHPNPQGLGATIEGADLGALTPSDVAPLREALNAHHVLLIRGQRLTSERYVSFGRSLGEPKIYVDARKRDIEFPEITLIHNREATPAELRDSAQNWHSDASYDPVPMAMTMMYAVEAPERGGETLFCDMLAAWEALPEEMKAAVIGRVAEHSPEGDRRLLQDGEHRGDLGRPQAPSRHPLVIRHPQTNQPVLYAVSGSPYRIEGMADADGIDLLKALKAHCTEDRFVRAIKATPGDVLLWDNFAVMHAATPATYSDRDGERRMLHRITIVAAEVPEAWRIPHQEKAA